MMRRVAVATVLMFGSVVLASACAEEEIVLARLPSEKDAGHTIEAKRCVDDGECPGRTFCERTDCHDVAGLCASRSVVCEEEPSPVCGCDGITYWNDCLRRATGITAMIPGECQLPIAQLCGRKPGRPGPGPGPSCPSGFSCARLLPPMLPGPPGPPFKCGSDAPGTCWALPAVCSAPSGQRWIQCNTPVVKCTTTCDAIRSGEPHVRAFACP